MIHFHLPPALTHRKYLYLWLGFMISVAGSNMQFAAIHWHIRELTGEPDPLALGGIGLARILPVILFSIIGGAVADSFNRRRILFLMHSPLRHSRPRCLPTSPLLIKLRSGIFTS